MEKKVKFSDFGFSQETLEGINKKGFEEPTAIQSLTIPIMLQNDQNIIAQAQTGTGKTAAFGLPLIEKIDVEKSEIQAIVVVPTRELAIQVAEEINSLRGRKRLKITAIYGGQSISLQLNRLKKGVHIVIGTPGRIIDHLNRKSLNLKHIKHLILDEADEMLNMGFIEDVEEIMSHTGSDKKTLLFSATIPKKIEQLAQKYMGEHKILRVKKSQLVTNLTNQIYYEIKNSDKFEALSRIIDYVDNFYGLIFCRTKIDVDHLVTRLLDRGYDAEGLHGDISQAQRERTLEKFKKSRINVLVATDVAARGIDVNNLTHVINFSLPQNPESYVHRIGRTGRAGNEGTAITFITPSEYKKLMFIQRVAKTDIKKSKVPQVKDILKTKKDKFSIEIEKAIEGEIDNNYIKWAESLLENNSSEKVVAALLSNFLKDEFNKDNYSKIDEIKHKKRSERDFDSRNNSKNNSRNDSNYDVNYEDFNQNGKIRLFVALGKKDNMNPKKLVELLKSKVSIRNNEIKDIEVMETFSFITVPFDKAEKIITSFKKRGEAPLITQAKKSKSGKNLNKKKRKK